MIMARICLVRFIKTSLLRNIYHYYTLFVWKHAITLENNNKRAGNRRPDPFTKVLFTLTRCKATYSAIISRFLSWLNSTITLPQYHHSVYLLLFLTHALHLGSSLTAGYASAVFTDTVKIPATKVFHT